MRHTFWLLTLFACSSDSDPVALDPQTLCSDLGVYEGMEIDLDVTLDPTDVMLWGSSAAYCFPEMPCCNYAEFVYVIPSCGDVAVALIPDENHDGDRAALRCSSRGGNGGTECAQCDQPEARRVIGVRGVLGPEAVNSLSGGTYRALDVTSVRSSAD